MGLIPAHAGKTRTAQARPSSAGAHPRSRGENPLMVDAPACVAGSSPLTRGKRERLAHRLRLQGLIPAHAGKTSTPRPASPLTTGSSPLTRGKHEEGRRGGPQAGLIPAHAGKTTTTARKTTKAPAHPRSRGENFHDLFSLIGDRGSSPLTRGKHFLTCAFTAQIGQILESLELCASSESYSSPDAYATDAP